MLGVPSLYDLDRLDLTGYATIDLPAQKRVSDILAQLNDPGFVEAHHLVGRHLLHTTRDLNVKYSVVVYERDVDGDRVRVHADSLNEPFDINSGAKLLLGSTAKLRTLVTYLNIVTALHDRYADRPKTDLLAQAHGSDPLKGLGDDLACERPGPRIAANAGCGDAAPPLGRSRQLLHQRRQAFVP